MSASRDNPLVVKSGTCHALYAYDIGQSIDIDHCRRLIATVDWNGKIGHNRRAPRYFDYRPAPLMATQTAESLSVGSFRTLPSVDIVLYDFGAVSIAYEIPLAGPLEDLRELSCALAESQVLLPDSRKRAARVLEAIRKAVVKPGMADLVEDYAVFEIEETDAPWDPAGFCARNEPDLARVLRAERRALSAQEIADALSCRIAYGEEDVSLIDWNAAILFDREAEDVRAVLEFANVELLEMRFLDRQLDDALDRAYAANARHRGWRTVVPGLAGSGLRAVSRMQVDGALLFERVSNALKLLGDQFLARVYRLAAQRFHVGEWNASILRKLDATESIAKQMQERAASWRLELLEWIIIALIAFEIVLTLWPVKH